MTTATKRKGLFVFQLIEEHIKMGHSSGWQSEQVFTVPLSPKHRQQDRKALLKTVLDSTQALGIISKR